MNILDLIKRHNTTSSEYDSFPVNILEEKGHIEREEFFFESQKITLCSNGVSKSMNAKNFIKASINYNHSMNVRFSFNPLGTQIANVDFPEVSYNKNRILWSYNLMGGGLGVNSDVPSFMSLYYKQGELAKIGFSFKCTYPEFVIEFE